MSENLRSSDEEQPEGPVKEILDELESAFEKGSKAELTVSEPSGTLRVNTVFIEGLEEGILFVSESESSPVMGIRVSDVKNVKPSQGAKE